MANPRKPKATPEDAQSVEDRRTADLIATGGRYADLAEFAARWSITSTKARAEWHRLRLPLQRVKS